MNEILLSIMSISSSLFLNIYLIVYCYNLADKPFHLLEKKNLVILILITITQILVKTYFQGPLKLIISITVLFLFMHQITKNLSKNFLIFLFIEITIFIQETVIMLITSQFHLNFNSFGMMNIIFNNLVSLTGLILIKTKYPKKIYTKVYNLINGTKNKEIVTYSIMIILVMLISTIETYMKIPMYIILITNTLMAITVIAIIFKFVTAKSKLEKISSKYQVSINSIKEYEKLINTTRISNHENKNELLTIRNMVKDNSNSKVIKYIDKIIDNKIKDNEKIMKETFKIPEGGLRAIIYSKLCTMNKYKIDHELYISKNVATTDLIDIDEELIIDTCKILGVFLDNAIEEVKEMSEKNITIELYKEEMLVIEISNNYKKGIDINKIGKSNYTTKGKGHGYGLMLVDKIIEKNKNVLENERQINGEYFTQILKINV